MSCHKIMLRNFYLATLILCCIEFSFSYNYIDDNSGRNIHKYCRGKKSRFGKSKARRNVMRQVIDEDRSPVEFDVANFIRPEAKEEDKQEVNEKSSNTEYNDREKENPNYLHIGGESIDLNPLYKESMKTKQRRSNLDENEQSSLDGYRSLDNNEMNLEYHNPSFEHHHAKKCALKKIKLPFFFHKPAEINQRKNKKKRLFGLNYIPNKNATTDDIANMTVPYKIKRSYKTRVCPDCKKRFIAETNSDSQKNPEDKIIHNSRQFYQIFPDANTKINKNKNNGVDLEDINERKRKKREHRDGNQENNSLTRNERYFDKITLRQLNQLDEIEKKINRVKI